jgi:hypothetical protein
MGLSGNGAEVRLLFDENKGRSFYPLISSSAMKAGKNFVSTTLAL